MKLTALNEIKTGDLVTIQNRHALTYGSISSRTGGKFYADEIQYNEPTPMEHVLQHLADLHGVPVSHVHLKGTHQEGNQIIGDFIVRKPGTRNPELGTLNRRKAASIR